MLSENHSELETALLIQSFHASTSWDPSIYIKKPNVVVCMLACNLRMLAGRAETAGSLGVTGQSSSTLSESLSQN